MPSAYFEGSRSSATRYILTERGRTQEGFILLARAVYLTG